MRHSLLIISLFFINISLNNSWAQSAKPIENACNIIVKHEFTGYTSAQWDKTPKFNKSEIQLIHTYDKNKKEQVYVINYDKKNIGSEQIFTGIFKENGDFSKNINSKKILIDSIHVLTYVDKFAYSFIPHFKKAKISSLIEPIIISKSQKAGVFNSRNAGFTSTTTISIDDPIDVNINDKRLSAKDGILHIKTNKYNSFDHTEVYIQVSVDDNNWHTIETFKRWKSQSLKLSYEQITRKNGNYYNWLGKGLSFRIVKKLRDGSYTYGKTQSSIIFFPEGIQYSIEHVRRTACGDSKLVIYTKLDNPADAAILDVEGNVKWKLRVKKNPDEELLASTFYTCTFEKVENSDKYKVITNIDGDEKEDLLNKQGVDYLLYGELMLEELSPEFTYNHCIKTFVIPPKPPKVEISQKKDLFTVGTDKYDLLVATNPYAVLSIKDNYLFPKKRKPYKIRQIGVDDALAELYELPDNGVNGIESTQYAKYTKDFLAQCGKDGEWASYLRANYDDWFDTVKDGVEYTGTVPVMVYNKLQKMYPTSTKPVLPSNKPNRPIKPPLLEAEGRLLIASDNKTYIYSGEFGDYGYANEIKRLSLSYSSSSLEPSLPNLQTTSRDDDQVNQPYVWKYSAEGGTLYRYIRYNDNLPKAGYRPKYRKIKPIGDEGDEGRDRREEVRCTDVVGRYTVVGSSYLSFYARKGSDSYGYLTPFGEYLEKITNANSAFFSKEGRFILYTRSNIDGLYSTRSSHTDNGNANKISNFKINSIKYIDDTNTYCIFQGVNNKYYKRDLNIITVNDILADKITLEDLSPNKRVSNTWPKGIKQIFEDFKAAYEKKWMFENYGYKLKNIEANTIYPYQIYILDGDNCSSDTIDVSVKMPAQPVISFSDYIAPTSNCVKNGSVKVKYISDGINDYCLKGDGTQTLALKGTITVSGLGMQDTIKFYGYKEANHLKGKLLLKLPIDFSNPADLIVTPTAKTDKYSNNGSIKVELANATSKLKTFKLENSNVGTDTKQSQETTASEHTFSNLTSGTYNITVSFTNCANGSLSKSDVAVFNKEFSLTVDPIASNKFSENGKFILTLNNGAYRDISWEGSAAGIVSTEANDFTSGTFSASAGEYELIGKLKLSDTEYVTDTVDFVVEAPTFEGKVNIDYREEESGVVADFELSLAKTMRLGSAKLTLKKDNAIYAAANWEITERALPIGIYTVYLDNDHEEIEIFNFELTDQVLNSTAAVSEAVCPNSTVNISVNATGGFTDGDIKYGTDGMSFEGTTKFNGISDDDFTYYVKSSKTHEDDSGRYLMNVSRSFTKQFYVDIVRPEPVDAEVNYTNVTCNGKVNGSISLANFTGGNVNTNYKFKVGNRSWLNNTNTQSNLPTGYHTVYLKDAANTCPEVAIGEIEIIEPELLKIKRIDIEHPTCELNNGNIEVEVEGGNGVYQYVLYHEGKEYYNSGTETYLGTEKRFSETLTHGEYTIMIKDPFGCTVNTVAELSKYTNPHIIASEVSVTDAYCYGDNNGEVIVSNVAGSSALERIVLLKEGGRHDSIYNLPAKFTGLTQGNYTLKLYDANACESNQDYALRVKQPQALQLVVDTVRPVLYKDSNTAYVGCTVIGGNTGLKHIQLKDASHKNITATQERSDYRFNIENLTHGQYYLEVSDRKACVYTTSNFTIEQPSEPLKFEVVSREDAQCKAQTGSFTIEGKGGWGEYSYKKAEDYNYFTNNKFSGKHAGKYLVSVKDKLGAVYTKEVEISEPAEFLQLNILQTQLPSCENNGAIELSATGGTAPYQIMDVDGANSVKLNVGESHEYSALEANVYTFKTIDAKGCIYNAEIALGDEDLLREIKLSPKYPSSQGIKDGTLTATFIGGQAPFTYIWSKGDGTVLNASGAILEKLSPGFYAVTIQDNTGCSINAQAYLPGAYDIALSLKEKGEETSYLAHNGYAVFNFKVGNYKSAVVQKPNGSIVGYTLTNTDELFDAEGNLHLASLPGGDYNIRLEDKNDQSYFANFHIKRYEEFLFRNVEVKPALQRDVASGSAIATVKGGAPEYTYIWKNLDTNIQEEGFSRGVTTQLQKVKAGNYQLKVTDKYNNQISTQVQILEPEKDLNVSISDYRHESCKTYEDAFIKVIAEGGWGDYQFKHADEKHYNNTSQWNNLNVRTHTIYVSDKYGVTSSISFEITEPDYLNAKVSLVDSVNCNGLADGAIEFIIEGGTAPYRFAQSTTPDEWVNGNKDQGLVEGNYTYYFTDAHNCREQEVVNAYMPQPDILEFASIDVTHTTCNTDNGKLEIAMKGGSKPYNYEWYNASNKLISQENKVSNLAQNGSYRVEVYDYHSCQVSHLQTINPSSIPQINNIITSPVLCYGDSNGTAEITEFSAAEPYAECSFKWSNGQRGESSMGWSSNMHSVTIIDENNCESTKDFSIETPDALDVSISAFKDAHCYGYNDGHIEVYPLGGVGGYSYLWSNGDTEARAKELSKGEYNLQLKDANNCVYEHEFVINEPEEALVDIGEDIKICPGNTITIDGKNYPAHKWSLADEGVISEERYLSASEEKDYYLRVTNTIGCYAYDTISITIGNDALKADFLLTSETNMGDTLMIYELSNLALDSMKWDYNTTSFLKLEYEEKEDYILELETIDEGMFNVELYAYSGGCVSKVIKQVEVLPFDAEKEIVQELGYHEPLIQSIKVAPNPTDGNFDVLIELREEADVNVDIFNVNKGIKVNEKKLKSQQKYSVEYRLSHLNTGVYLVVVTAERERKQVKIIIK